MRDLWVRVSEECYARLSEAHEDGATATATLVLEAWHLGDLVGKRGKR